MPSKQGLRHWERGVRHYQSKQMPEALREWEQAIQADPNVAEWRYNYGVALSESGRMDDAIEQWNAALKARPGFSEAQTALALVQVDNLQTSKNREDLEEARKTLQRAVDLTPKALPLRRNLAMLEWKLGNKTAAMDILEDLLRLDPTDQDAMQILASWQFRAWRWRAAWRTARTLATLRAGV